MNSRQIRVLLVEDNPQDVEQFRRSCKRARFHLACQCATTLNDGLEWLSRETFDVVVTDLSLPDSEGCDTVRCLRDGMQDIPIIVLTGMDDHEYAYGLLQTGADDYLIKGKMSGEQLERSIFHAIQRYESLFNHHASLAELESHREAIEAEKNRLASQVNETRLRIDSVSQQIQTPLAAIKQSVEMIADGKLGDVSQEQSRLLRVVRQQTDDLRSIVEGIRCN